MTETTNPQSPTPCPGEAARPMTAQELSLRHARCRRLLAALCPGAEGLLVCGKANIYYLSGTGVDGLLWLPLENEPVLLVRKGLGRAVDESPLARIVAYRSYREIAKRCAEAGSPLGRHLAVDKNRFSWAMADMIASRMPGVEFLAGDAVLSRARAVKTPFEQDILRACGRLHAAILDGTFPARIRPGMSERAMAAIYVQEALAMGSEGLVRTSANGSEMFFGFVSAGENGLYPTSFSGPLGGRGTHPATPFLGSGEKAWKEGEPLCVDMGCTLGGYVTDRTQTYWAGPAQSVPATVRKAQDACVEILERARQALLPGASPAHLWQAALERAGELGFKEEFMGLGRERPVFLGHGVGLELDEWPPLAKTVTAPLEEGMVIALEPKVGLAGIGMVGVEHTYLVTAKGGVSLTGATTDLVCIG